MAHPDPGPLLEPRPTTRVRVKVLISSEGNYAAYGYAEADEGDCDEVLYDMMSGKDDTNLREYFITAMVPTPERVEIVGEISAADVIEVPDA